MRLSRAGRDLLALLLFAGLPAGPAAETTASPAPPAIFWVSDPILPGDAAMVIGEGFGDRPVVEIARLADDPEVTESPLTVAPAWWRRGPRQAEVLQADAQSVKFVLPRAAEPGVFAFRITGPGGDRVGLLNRPVIWWVQGDGGPAATPGGWIRLFGKNLTCVAATAARPRPGTVRLATGARARALPAVADPYSARVELPSDLTPGEYRLTYHSGCGDRSAWAEAVSVKIEPRPSPFPTVLTATEFGADPRGSSDSTEALRRALAAIERAGGGTLCLPRGRYLVADRLELPRGTTLKGEDREWTCLFWPDLPTPPDALLRGSGAFAVEALTLYASNHTDIIVADQSGPAAGNVALRRVRVRADAYRGHLTPEQVNERLTSALKRSTGGGDTVRLGGPNVVVTDCDLYGSGRVLYLSGVRGGVVRNNTLYNGRWGWYCFSGSNGLVFEDNRLVGADLMSTGGGLNCLDGSTCSQNVYYARNQLSLMHGWDREAMTSDAGGGAYFGGVAGVDGDRTTLADAPQTGNRDWAGAGLFVLDGRGRGQYRQVVAVEGQVVKLDRPWQVEPDRSSTVSLTMLQRHYLFIGNSFSDSGVALQLYGMAVEDIADGNVSTRTAGFHNFGMNYHGIQPSWFIQWLGNTIEEGNSYRSGHDNYMLSGEAHLGIFALPPRVDFRTPLTLGCVARRNRLLNNAHIAVGGTDPHSSAHAESTVQDIVVEDNEVRDADLGIWLRRAARNVLLRRNRFLRVREEIRDEVQLLRAAEERRCQLLARPGPLAAWDFEGMTDTVVPDVSGNGFHASVVGTVTCESGRAGQGLRLTGSSYLRLDEPVFFNLQDLTLSLWIKPDEVKGRHGLIAKRFAGAAAPFVLSLWDGALEFEATDTTGAWSLNFRSPPVVVAGTWTHVAAVAQRGKGVTLYANGRPVAGKENALDRVANDEPLILGREAWAGVNMVHEPCYFVGLVDEVRVWARALSAAEVQAEFSRLPAP